MILAGELSLWVALLMAAWCSTVSFAGGRLGRTDLVVSGERAVYATCALTAVAAIGLWTALLTHDFSLEYVASTTSRNMPLVYVVAALWGGQAGSMLFWCLLLAGFSAIAVASSRTRLGPMMPYVTGTLGVVLLFFLAATCFGANPYARTEWVPLDGRGMNPQLQNPGMALHPPNLYLGFTSATIPFAFAVGALVTRRLDGAWLAVVRRWSVLSWFFLTTGITLGMWWAYVELGWGGYWFWDPVENSSLLPWLTTTAFLHSIMVQEKRGMLRKWNVVLVVTSFLLTIFGTFITRSGIVESVHSFAQSPVGNWFAGFFLLSVTATAYLVATRLRDLRTPVHLESMVSREAAFLYNNLLLVGISFSVLWGTLFPIISEAVRGTKITVGPAFFNAVNIPLGLLLLALTGIGPLIAWRRASVANLRRQFVAPVATGAAVGALLLALGMRDLYALLAYSIGGFVLGTITQEFQKGVVARRRIHGEGIAVALLRLITRNRRRYGGYIVHAGVVVLFAGFAGLAFKREFDITLQTGQAYEATDPFGHRWRFVSQGISRFEILNRRVTAVALDTWRDGERMGVVRSEKRQHVDSRGLPTFDPSTEVGIIERPRQDTYVVLAGVRDEAAELRIAFNPLVMWVWAGGIIMAVGGLIVLWPQTEASRRRDAAATQPGVAEPMRETVGAW